jgi:hypothetical protein
VQVLRQLHLAPVEKKIFFFPAVCNLNESSLLRFSLRRRYSPIRIGCALRLPAAKVQELAV